MKGIVLAGGSGSRLYPLTKVTNKHLLPVYDQPMIYYPLQALVKAGVEDILIVTGGNHAGEFLKLLGNGREFGLGHLNYTYQERPAGIADALGLAEHFAAGDKVAVLLADNILEHDIVGPVNSFLGQAEGAKILLTEVANPKEYGIAQLRDGTIVRVEEKPEAPLSNLAVIGVYFYDSRVFDIVKTLKPSRRGELEITDVNNAYIQSGTMTFEILKGWWGDCGESVEALLRVANLVAKTGANNDRSTSDSASEEAEVEVTKQ